MAPAGGQAPYGFHQISTRETASHVLYDPFHQRFYGTVPGEDAVYVMAEADGSLIQKISVPSAYGLDLSVDGTKLYVSSNVTILGYASAQMIFVVDTSTLHIADVIRPTVTNSPSAYVADNAPEFLASLSDGRLAYTTTGVGVTGGALFVYDPTSGLANAIVPVGYYEGLISKAANGNGFVAISGDSAGEEVNVYDTASATYTANVYFSTTNNGDVAVSPDGSMVLLGGHILCNRSLQQVADIAVAGQPTTMAWSSTGSGFSPDGTKIYVASTLNATSTNAGGGTLSYSNPVVYIFSASTHTLLNTMPLPEGTSGMAVGSSGKAMVVAGAGFLEIDPSTAPATLVGTYNQTITQTLSPDAGSPTAPQPTTVNGSGFRTATVYFGKTSVPVTSTSSTSLSVQPPPSSAGLVDVSVLFSDGWALLAPQAYSYGPVITKLSETAGSSDGGTTVTAYGHGFDVATGYATVLVGGRSATVSTSNATSVTFTTPSGTIGPADVQLTSAYGTTTVPGGFTYVTQQLIPSLLSNQMVVDNARNQLYVADANTGNVFVVNASTLAASTLFTPPSGGVTALAMTPDGSELLALNGPACTLDIINLTTGKDVQTIVPTPGNQPGSFFPSELAATANGTALVSLIDTSLYDDGELVETNLSSGTTTVAQTNMFSGTLLASSADGTLIYVAVSSADGSSGGAPELWSSAADGFVKTTITGEWGPDDLSTTDLGDRMFDGCYGVDQNDTWLRISTVCAPDSQLVSGRSPVLGVNLHSSGSLGYLPTTKGVEISDIHHGQMLLAIGDAAGSLAGSANLAISHDGSRLYVAQPNGIGVITLPTVPLSIGSLTPSSGGAGGGETVVLRGSGFAQGISVTVDGQQASVQFVDSTKLTLTMPAVTAAKDIVTVTNPNGGSYSLDAAWDASIAVPTVPVLSSISPTQVSIGGAVTFTVNGSGFVPDSVVLLNGIVGKTSFVSTTQLTGTFSHLPGPGTQLVTAENPGSTTQSNALSVITFDEVPYLGSLTPASIPAGSESFQLTAFMDAAVPPTGVLMWNGTALVSQVIDPNHIIAQIPAALVATTGSAKIMVSVPQATPSTSNAQTFTITPSVAAMGFSTSSVVVGPAIVGGTASATFTITATGALPLTITKIAANDSNFSFSGCITTLNQGQSCTATVVYTPVNNEGDLASLTVTSNAATQPLVTVQGLGGSVDFFPSSTDESVKAGQSVTDSINVATYGNTPGFTAQLTCSGLPANATCSFSPSSFTMKASSGNGNNSASFNVTITTQAPVYGALRGRSLGAGAAALAMMLFLFRLPRKKRMVPLACIGIVLLVGLVGCGSTGGATGGGGGTPTGGTPSGSYPVTITAKISASIAVTQVITLNVQ